MNEYQPHYRSGIICEMLQAYIYLAKKRLGHKLEVSISASDELKDYLVPAFILQPIVENAVKHAIEPLLSNGQIEISVSTVGDHLVIRVSDNGQAPFSGIDFKNGVGLNNTRERLKNLYSTGFELDYSPNAGQGTTVTLSVPLQKQSIYESEYIDS